MNLRVRAAERKWEDEARVQLTVLKATPLNYADESRAMISAIEKYFMH